MPQNFLSALQRGQTSPTGVILGTNEIASAVAVFMRRVGWSVVLTHDPLLPVIRRAMSFHDALFEDAAIIEGIAGERAETVWEIVDVFDQPDRVAVTSLGLTDLLAFGSPDVLVDARMQKQHVTPDLRNLARVAVGLGPNFAVGSNCDVAVETHPAHCGEVVKTGRTVNVDPHCRPLGEVGSERFVYSELMGRWHTPIEIGARVFKGVVLGYLETIPIRAPLDGVVRGIVRDGLHVPPNVKLLEIDPRGRAASWTGIDDRGRDIAAATVKAMRIRTAQPVTSYRSLDILIKGSADFETRH